jgi:hypothetical protein
MATKLQKIGALQKVPGVTLRGDETNAELDKLIKQHLSVDPGKNEEEDTIDVVDEEAENEITFHLRGSIPSKRIFDRDTHGDDFNDLANQFHETNKERISDRLHDGVSVNKKTKKQSKDSDDSEDEDESEDDEEDDSKDSE